MGKLLFLCLLALAPTVSWAEKLNIQLLLSDQSAPYREFATALNRALAKEKADVLVSESVAGTPDMLIAVGIKATESAVAKSVAPVLGVMVPLAGYGTLLEKIAGQHRQNPVSAIYIEQPWGRQLDFIQAALPEQRRLGLLYSSSTHLDIRALQPEAVWRGLTLKTAQTSSQDTLFDDLNHLLDDSNVLLATPDNQVYNSSNIRNILLSSYRHKVPLVGLSQAYVNAGALCAIFTTPEQTAQQAGELVLAFMKTRRLPPPQYPAEFTIGLNPQVARSLGITLDSPETIRERMRKAGGGGEVKRIGIRQQVALLTFIPSLVMAICLETWFLHDRFADMDEDLLESGKLIAAQLAASSEYGVFSSNQLFLQKIARNTLEQPDVRGILILNSASEVLVRTGRFSGQISDASGVIQNAHLDSALVGPVTPIAGDEHSLWVYHPIIPEQITLDEIEAVAAPQQTGAVVVEMSKLNNEQTKSRMLWGTLFATAVFLNLVLYIVYRASRSITQPVRQLSWAIQAIGEGDLDTHVSLPTRIQELDMLAHGLNRMVGELREERRILEQRIENATQALRLKKEEAERASHDKSRFLATASHDLRQPLHALGLYVGELQRKVSSDELRKLVGQIDYSIEALSTLLNALLDISKLDAGAIVPKMQPSDVRSILEHIAADFHMLAVIKEIRLVVHPCPEFVNSDPVLLERILTNLVSNAIRYTKPGGCVMIACRRRGNLLRIEVRDNGIGIPKENQAEIFWEFFQLNQQRQDASKGLGLGLSIVDRLVKLLGHHLYLRSASGKGSVFAIEAQRTPYLVNFDGEASGSFALANTGQGADTTVLTGKRVLVVDDDAAVLSSTSGLLKSWGCDVSSADSLSEVEQLLRNGLICDFIVTDYQLGKDATGLGVIDIVRQHFGKPIPCILISGDTRSELLALAKKKGITLLHKPLKPAKLRSLLVHFLSAPSDTPIIEYEI